MDGNYTKIDEFIFKKFEEQKDKVMPDSKNFFREEFKKRLLGHEDIFEKNVDFEIEEKEFSDILSETNTAAEIDILIPIGSLPNMYMLRFFAVLAKFFRENSKNPSIININFLSVDKTISELDFFTEQVIDHHNHVIPDAKNKLEAISYIKSLDFKSLVNYILTNLEKMKKNEIKKLILTNVSYKDISEYKEEIKVADSANEEKIENYMNSIKPKTGKRSDMNMYLFETKPQLINEYLSIMAYLSLSSKIEEKKQIIWIIDESIKHYIDDFLDWFAKEFQNGNKNRYIYCTDPPLTKRGKLPFYLSITSEYINERTIGSIDEYYFSKVLKMLGCGLFEHKNLEEIYRTKLTTYNSRRSKCITLKNHKYNELIDKRNEYPNKDTVIQENMKQQAIPDLIEEIVGREKDFEKETEDTKDNIHTITKNINTGFLKIQSEILSQIGSIT